MLLIELLEHMDIWLRNMPCSDISLSRHVYNFGILILEIVCGKKHNSLHQGEKVVDLISDAWRNWREGTVLDIVDPCLRWGTIAEH